MTIAPSESVAAWSHATADIPARGLDTSWRASPDDLAALAAGLEVLSLDSLAVDYRIVPLSGGRFRLTGKLRARLSQACVVTLDPVPARIDQPLDVEFRPPAEIPVGPASVEDEAAILQDGEYEPIEHSRLAVGRIVVETLASVLAPYPRSPGAALDQHEAGPAGGGTVSPFAALADWKPKPE